MTEPVQYETKPSHETSAIFYDGSPESIAAIAGWVNPTEPEGAYTNPMGVLVVPTGGSGNLVIPPEHYVYLRGLEYVVASKGAFEMYYQVANGA